MLSLRSASLSTAKMPATASTQRQQLDRDDERRSWRLRSARNPRSPPEGRARRDRTRRDRSGSSGSPRPGSCSQARRRARSAPASEISEAQNHRPSGTSATALTRCAHQWRDAFLGGAEAERAAQRRAQPGFGHVSPAPPAGDIGDHRQHDAGRHHDVAAAIGRRNLVATAASQARCRMPLQRW